MKQFIAHVRRIVEVYEVDADSIDEAKEIVERNWNPDAPNIVHSEVDERFLCANSIYKIVEQQNPHLI